MFRKQPATVASCFSLLALALLTVVPASRGQSTATLTTLHSFQGNDGGVPAGGLLVGSDGNLYGTTSGFTITVTNAAGDTETAGNFGTVFKITPAGVLSTLYTFPILANGAFLNGVSPMGSLVQGGSSDILYGTTSGLIDAITITTTAATATSPATTSTTSTTSSVADGTVFKITTAGAITSLYNFAGSAAGIAPVAGLFLGSDGPLYGTTSGGTSGDGTLFTITDLGALTTLHGFTGGLDGSKPLGALVEGGDGNYYGTTSSGGSVTVAGITITDEGTVFQLTPLGTLTTIYSFTGGADGGVPTAGLVRPNDGYLYGTTTNGGNGYGTIFKITSSGKLTTVYTFTGADDGSIPNSLIVGSDGNLYGTTSGFAGLTVTGESVTDYGTIFQLTPGGALTTLYHFNGKKAGGTPGGALVEDGSGNFYGTTTAGGGAYGVGTVFKLTISRPAFFDGAVVLGDSVYYLGFANGNYFGYYSDLGSGYIYHFDLGYEYVIDAADGNGGVYLYDFASGDFFYTSPIYPFPYLYDFNLDSVLYYYPDTTNAGHYTSNPRYFYDFNAGQIISK